MKTATDTSDMRSQPQDQLYVSFGKNPKKIDSRLLAFTMPDNSPEEIVKGFTVAWTKPALRLLLELKDAARSEENATIKNLPYKSLRGMMKVNFETLARLESNLGLFHQRDDSSPPFAYLTETSNKEIQKRLRALLNDWLTGFLTPFIQRNSFPEESLSRLIDLWEENKLLTISSFETQVLPWSQNPATGTARPKNSTKVSAYTALADYATRYIAGHEVFPGLGPMQRIIHSSGGMTSGQAELITRPIDVTDTGIFSLVLTLEVITFPSIHQPFLKMNVSKRRWLNHLEDPSYFNRNNINGYVFSREHPDRIFGFQVTARREGSQWRWESDKDFEILRRYLELPMRPFSGQEIASGQANTDKYRCLLTYRNGLTENSEIKAGVPEIDKLDAFEALTEILNSAGIYPFKDYKSISAKHSRDKAGSRMINLPTLMSAIVEIIHSDNTDFTPNYLSTVEDSQLDELLRQNFGIRLSEVRGGRKKLNYSKKSSDQVDELLALTQENRNALNRMYLDEHQLLIIFYGDELAIEKDLLEVLVKVLWGDDIEILSSRLPLDTHGAKATLPGNELKARERSQQRIEAWQSTTQQIKNQGKRVSCLILARKFYPNSSTGKPMSDDRINKAATRQALASMANSSVQFLLPMQKARTTGSLNLQDFFLRAQASFKDLFSAHSGRIDGVKVKIDDHLEDIPEENRPKQVIGITIVRKQGGRAKGKIGKTFLAIAIRIDVETGNCELRCAYEKANTVEISPWSCFADALSLLSQISPVKLADERSVQRTRFARFVEKVVTEAVDADKQPLVLIDSSNCAGLWSWLTDQNINTNQIDIGTSESMQHTWKGARIVRIRQGLSPGLIDKTERQLGASNPDDKRTKDMIKSLQPDLIIPCASSSANLLRFTTDEKTGCVPYLSVRNDDINRERRGQSCYRNTQKLTEAKNGQGESVLNAAGSKLHQIENSLPNIGQWPTPNPLEIVVALRQLNDDPDKIAALVESLRYGFGHYSESTALPAPLFFERVVRDYISEFSFEESDENDAE